MSAHSEETRIEDQFIEAAPTVLVPARMRPASASTSGWPASLGPDMSRSRVQMLIKQGAVSVDGKPVDETKRKMAAGERVVGRHAGAGAGRAARRGDPARHPL